jgi:serine O-acetyltransferase
MNSNSFFALIFQDLIRFVNSKEEISQLKIWLRIIHPRFLPVLLVRLSHSLYKRKLTRPLSFLPSICNIVFFGLEVTPKCIIGKGLYLPHTVGTVIGAKIIGENVTIFQGVTLGAKYADTEFTIDSRPVIGNDVIIGAGAKVLGNISIGNNSIISANSLVVSTVPDGVVMIGVPAKVKSDI